MLPQSLKGTHIIYRMWNDFVYNCPTFSNKSAFNLPIRYNLQ
jgi:hypothetical protein